MNMMTMVYIFQRTLWGCKIGVMCFSLINSFVCVPQARKER